MSRDRRLVLAFDCDDVLVDTSHTLLDTYNAVYGTTVPYEGFYNDKLWQAPDEETAASRVDSIIRMGAVAHVAPNDETIGVIEDLYNAGHELHVVTGRQSYQEPETLSMLNEYFHGVFQTVEHTNMYASGDNIHLRRSKGEVCRLIGAHVLIDDHIYHGSNVIENGVERAIVFGNYPWNQFTELSSQMVHCSTMIEVESEIAKLSKGVSIREDGTNKRY